MTDKTIQQHIGTFVSFTLVDSAVADVVCAKPLLELGHDCWKNKPDELISSHSRSYDLTHSKPYRK
ncbi:MAG: hypothetical protein F6K65_05090 [Moorea sp. SIO3C2]|nr:hypothetical protein [Moorena sp. SIO3C2]